MPTKIINGRLVCTCRECQRLGEPATWTAVGKSKPRRCGNPKYRHQHWDIEPKKKSKPFDNSQAEKRELALNLLASDFPMHCSRLRAGMKLSQQRLAELMGIKNKVGKITVSRWESGNHPPSRKYLLKFLEIQKAFDDK